MRSRSMIAGAVALTMALGIAGVAVSAPAELTFDAQLSNKTKPKLDKKKFKKSELTLEATNTDEANPSGVPPKPNRAVFELVKKNVKIDTKKAGTCAQAQLENTTTEEALAACKSAKVGTGGLTAVLPSGANSTAEFPADLTAFNGDAKNSIYFHLRVGAPLNATIIITLVVEKKSVLDIDVPPVAGGAGSFTDFFVTLKKGKYVQARCKTKTMTSEFTASFTDAPDASAESTQKCKA